MFEKIKLQINYLIYKISCKNINNCNIISDLGMILKEVDKIKHHKIPKCNMQKLSNKTDGFTKINGQSLPGTLSTLVDSKVLLDICNAQGQRVYIVKSIRKAGTRVGIHVHKYGGYTLIALLFFVPLSLFIERNLISDFKLKKKITILICLSFLFFLSKNVNRLLKENEKYNFNPLINAHYYINPNANHFIDLLSKAEKKRNNNGEKFYIVLNRDLIKKIRSDND